jgi:hypothetical protein
MIQKVSGITNRAEKKIIFPLLFGENYGILYKYAPVAEKRPALRRAFGGLVFGLKC